MRVKLKITFRSLMSVVGILAVLAVLAAIAIPDFLKYGCRFRRVPTRPCEQEVSLIEDEGDQAVKLAPLLTLGETNVMKMKFSLDGKRLAVVRAKKLELWDTKKMVKNWERFEEDDVLDLSFSRSGKLLAYGTARRTNPPRRKAVVLRADDGSIYRQLKSEQKDPRFETDAIWLLGDGGLILSHPFFHERLKVWDFKSNRLTPYGKNKMTIPFGWGLVTSEEVTPEQGGLNRIKYNSNILVHPMSGKKVILEPLDWQRRDRAISDNGSVLLHLGRRRKHGHSGPVVVEVVDLRKYEIIGRHEFASGWPRFTGSSNHVAIIESHLKYPGKRCRIIELSSGETKLDLARDDRLFNAVSITDSGKHAAVAWTQAGVRGIDLVDLDTGEILGSAETPRYTAFFGGFFTGDVFGVATAGELRLIEIGTGRTKPSMGQGLGVMWAAPLPDGKFVGLCEKAGQDGDLRCMKYKRKKQVFDSVPPLISAAISNDGRYIAAGTWSCGRENGPCIDVFDVSKAKPVANFSEGLHGLCRNGRDMYYGMAFLPDNRLLFNSMVSQTLYLWDWEKNEVIKDLSDCLGYESFSRINNFATDPAGKVILTGRERGSCLLLYMGYLIYEAEDKGPIQVGLGSHGDKP